MPAKPRGLSKDSGAGGEPSKWLSPRILTLQKSISTPSILAVKDGSALAALSHSKNVTVAPVGSNTLPATGVIVTGTGVKEPGVIAVPSS